ncbi:hypothetical protein H4582DRAFT_34993 [Lactarius indigo]|nr:hypothetical protein H4582DRAFT_34993 [Lactarius indigo]
MARVDNKHSSTNMGGDHTDVLSMSESESRGLPYYHLGRVPCRSVSLVAIVVEATAYENRDLYTLDDGTGTVECTFRVDQDAQGGRASKKHDAPRSNQEPTKQRSSPLIPVGSVVRVQGRVRAKRNSREIYGESIERCHGPGVELAHWRQVIALHEKHYFVPEEFVVPSSSAVAFGAQDVPRTPKSAATNVPIPVSTPSTHSTPSSSASLSPQKSSKDPSLPPRLRHPSRLRSRDLTENTFRIYVKHFMDNLRYLNFGSQSCGSDSDSDTNPAAEAQMPKTPTKQSPTTFDERTPRLRRRGDALCTPRPPSRHTSCVGRPGFCDEARAVVGCTLSFLLRVPELATLARRVVEAEARRREKTKRPQSGAANVDPAAGKRKGLASSTEGSTPKVKRLFSWAIRKLYQDGSIILWDGPVLSPPEPHATLDSSMLYRSTLLDDSCGSSTTLRLGSQSADHTEDLSDPPSDEEAYASLSTLYLATQVERAIRSLQTRQKGEAENAFLGPAVARRRHLPLPGPTTDDITNHLKREDDRWKRVTTWAIQEALEWLRDNGLRLVC